MDRVVGFYPTDSGSNPDRVSNKESMRRDFLKKIAVLPALVLPPVLTPGVAQPQNIRTIEPGELPNPKPPCDHRLWKWDVDSIGRPAAVIITEPTSLITAEKLHVIYCMDCKFVMDSHTYGACYVCK